MTDWTSDETQTANFGDKRLDRRYSRVMKALSSNPSDSLANVVANRNDREALYQFFSNNKVDPEKILSSHYAQTISRAEATPTDLLFLNDTTEINLTRPNCQLEGVGTTSADYLYGMYLHPLLVCDAGGLPLGLLNAQMWTREITRLTGEERREANKNKPFEEKESYRWIKGAQTVVQYAEDHPDQRCVYVADRESDIYSLFALSQASPSNYNFVIRGCINRRTKRSGANPNEIAFLHDQIPHLNKKGTIRVTVKTKNTNTGVESDKQSSGVCEIKADVSAGTITILRAHSNSRDSKEVAVHVVYVKEKEGTRKLSTNEKPVEWLLITSLPIDTLEECLQVVNYYKVRWQIEIFFLTLKQCCNIEERRLETYERYVNCLSCYSIIAWHIMYICYICRTYPDVSCETIFTRDEWQAITARFDKDAKPAKKPPKMADFVMLIAQLGGYKLNPKYQPGVKTIYRGVEKMVVVVEDWLHFRKPKNKSKPSNSEKNGQKDTW